MRVAVATCSLLVAIAVATGAARAVLIDSGDGAGNTEAPPDDPGWRNVATLRGKSAVYLRDRWVITARHVDAGDVTIDGEDYAMLQGSRVVILNDKGKTCDLVLFQIDRKPPVEPAWISESSPPSGTALVLIGNGLSRGPSFRFQMHAGYRWGVHSSRRWGTSEVTWRQSRDRISGTDTFPARFSFSASKHEAIASRGDSGGAAFIRGKDRWELAGILLAVSSYPNQPKDTSVYGNQTFIADLSVYRDQIHRIMQGDSAADRSSDPASNLTPDPE